MNEGFGPVWAEMVDRRFLVVERRFLVVERRFLVVERFIGCRFSYGLVRESVSKVDSSCHSFGP